MAFAAAPANDDASSSPRYRTASSSSPLRRLRPPPPGLLPCLAFVQGKARVPMLECCYDVKLLEAKSFKCLSVLVKDRNEPELAIKIDVNHVVALLSLCSVRRHSHSLHWLRRSIANASSHRRPALASPPFPRHRPLCRQLRSLLSPLPSHRWLLPSRCRRWLLPPSSALSLSLPMPPTPIAAVSHCASFSRHRPRCRRLHPRRRRTLCFKHNA